MILITSDCGDYYCEMDHPVGLCKTAEEADQLIEKAIGVSGHHRNSFFTEEIEFNQLTEPVGRWG